jgi:hypothetical protein
MQQIGNKKVIHYLFNLFSVNLNLHKHSFLRRL